MAALLGRAGGRWTVPFLVLAILTSATGFLFPFLGVTPAFATGIVASVVLALVLWARYGRHLEGGWRKVDAVGQVISLYLLVFVLIVQLFLKVPALNALAPTGSEPPFAVVQAVCLAVFIWIVWRALRHVPPGSRPARPRRGGLAWAESASGWASHAHGSKFGERPPSRA